MECEKLMKQEITGWFESNGAVKVFINFQGQVWQVEQMAVVE